MNYENLPIQARTDVDECVMAYYHGGIHLAELTFTAIAEARRLTKLEASLAGLSIRERLIHLGYLIGDRGR